MTEDTSVTLISKQPVEAPDQKPSSSERAAKSDLTVGLLAGLGAAFFYTVANICLRRVVHCDPLWVAGVKALPTVIVALPFLGARYFQSKPLLHSTKTFLPFVAISCLAQLFGNGLFQWALGLLGLALAIPLTLGGVLIGSAVVGQMFLGERVSRASVISIAVLVLSICVLSTGAANASEVLHEQLAKAGRPSPLLTGVAIAAFCLAGFVFSILGATVRRVAKDGMPMSTILVTSGLVGLLLLCAIALIQNPGLITSTTVRDWNSMMGAGLFNAIAFWLLTIALRRIRLLYVNALNVTQTAMAGVAGVVLFAEPTSPQLFIGIGLTVVGVFLMDRH
jgi:drug/metabolite transporter (DMT)-like permease